MTFAKMHHDTRKEAGPAQADLLFKMGLVYATGHGCAVDLVAAHTWFNIAAIKGCDQAQQARTHVAARMNKQQLAAALRAAREWMTLH